jgi:hypothetical protein
VKQPIRIVGSFCVAGFLLSAGPLLGQSREELKRKYGEPLSEVFVVRPGVNAMATFAADGRIVELLISPRIAGATKSRGTTLSRDTVNAILDELVPNSVRGKYIIAGFANGACLPEDDCAGSYQQFENLSIYYNAGRDGGLCYAVVQWKE